MNIEQELMEELEELKGRLSALMVVFPDMDMSKPIERITDWFKKPNNLKLKLLIDELYFLNILFEKILADSKYDNTWKMVKPCYVLVTNLLAADE